MKIVRVADFKSYTVLIESPDEEWAFGKMLNTYADVPLERGLSDEDVKRFYEIQQVMKKEFNKYLQGAEVWVE